MSKENIVENLIDIKYPPDPDGSQSLMNKVRKSQSYDFTFAAMVIWAKEVAIDYLKWFYNENPYNSIYHSDDDNNGKWFDEFSEGVSRHYYTDEQLFSLYMVHLERKAMKDKNSLLPEIIQAPLYAQSKNK